MLCNGILNKCPCLRMRSEEDSCLESPVCLGLSWSEWNVECLQLYCQVCAILGARRHCLRNIWNLRAGGEERQRLLGDKYRRFEGKRGNNTLQCLSIILVCSLNVAAMFLFNLYWRSGQLNEKSSIGDHHLGRSPMPMGTTESPEIF